jgi:cysteine-rich repeat protein
MLATAVVMLAVITGSARGQGVVDQETTCNDGGSAQIQFYEPIAQRFRPRAPSLTAVDLLLGRFNAPYADTLTLRIAKDSVGGAFVASTSLLVTAGPTYSWFRFTLPSPVQMVPGAPYVLQLDATSPAIGWAHQYELPPRCSYPAGEEIVSGTPVPGLDASFRTYTLCGNGVRDAGEQCDDGNDVDTDGCTRACTVCGNRIVSGGEECDDGNVVSGDGCDANCTISDCGNGIVSPGEQCDDGNRNDGDCCSSTCTFESSGTSCVDDGNPCTSDVCDGGGACTHPNNTSPCSDGNLCNGDDFCSNGSCAVHGGNPCSAEPDCQRACVQTSPLQYQCTIDPKGTACASDGQPCTVDQCNGAGVCTHATAPNGSSCEDGDRCTSGDVCMGGTCQTGTSATCDPCLACDPSTGACTPPTGLVCAPAASDKSTIVLKDSVSSRTDRVLWKWKSRGQFTKAEVGAPNTSTSLTLCVFDRNGLKVSATAPAGGTCSGRQCWREVPLGYRYADADGTPDGLSKIQAKAGSSGQGRLVVRGRGPLLDMPPLGLTPPVTVRLRRGDDAGCWESTYSVPTVSDMLQFKARGD